MVQVLILVLVEHTLREFSTVTGEALGEVLILVLVEHTLREYRHLRFSISPLS